MSATAYPKRLIEVDLPIRRISAHARREKSGVRHGHISTLHIWWARRPLAACRAVICASLWPDPVDEHCPQAFRDKALESIKAFAEKAVNDPKLGASCHPETLGKYLAVTGRIGDASSSHATSKEVKKKQKHMPTPELNAADPAHLDVLRYLLLDFIADFANWNNSTVREYLETGRALTQAAHEALGGMPGTKPLVVDPFAGGGAIPLEALRIGADAFASDLNPVAVLLNKVVLEYIPKYGQKLTDELRKWGKWIKQEAEKELAEFYPKDPDGATPIAYLWARTVRCEAPTCGIDVPLLGNLWLSKRGANRAALRLETSGPGHPVDIQVVNNPENVGKGLTSGNSATCPACGYTTPVSHVRQQLIPRRGGSTDSILLAVVTQRTNGEGKEFRPPSERDLELADAAKSALLRFESMNVGALSLIPDEQCPPEGALGFRFQKYGITSWRDLYTHRQLLTLCTFTHLVAGEKTRELLSREIGSELASIVQAILALAVGRLNDRLCTLCRWRPDKNNVEAANGGQNKMPMLLDFAESSPFGGSSGDWEDHVEWIIRVIEHLAESGITGATVQQGPAQTPILPNDSASALMTDPPYFNAFGYSDLSEFFHIWLRRAVPVTAIDLQSSGVPKREEAISIGGDLGDGRGVKNASTYSEEMMRAFTVARHTTAPNGIGVIVFANKSTAGWEAILEGLVGAGWTATASWPIDTELANRQRAIGSAALNSSVHIVCRPREYPDGSLCTDEVGDWRDVLHELPIRIHEWMPRLAHEGIVGADAIFACIGPALEIFSRYSRVEKASGEQVMLREYLEQVWAVVAREALALIFEDADTADFEEDARLTAIWFWVLKEASNGNGYVSQEPVDADDMNNEGAEDAESVEANDVANSKKAPGYSMEYDAARKLGQGLGVDLQKLNRPGGIITVTGNIARMNTVAEREAALVGFQMSLFGDSIILPRRRGRSLMSDPKATMRNVQDRQASLFDQPKVPISDRSEPILPLAELRENPRPLIGRLVESGHTVLDRLHQAMLLFGRSQTSLIGPLLAETRVGNDQRFWRLAQALSALYPSGSEEKRWVDGVLGRKKALGF